MFVGLFELGVSKKYNTLLTKSTSTEDGPVAVGGSFLNIEKLVDTVKLQLLAEGVRVLEGLCHVCGPQQGLGACPCLWPIRNGRERKTLAEHFFRIHAGSFAANENAECDAVVSCLTAKCFTSHPFNTGHQRATTL